MKKAPLIALFLAAALMTLSGCGKITPDRPIPQPKDPEPEKPEDPKVPEEPAGSDFIDVETAFKQMHLVSFVQSCNHYSPHSGVDVTEFRYNDYVANPQAVFVMQADLSDETVSMTNTVPGDAKTSFNAGRETLTGQFKRPRDNLAAYLPDDVQISVQAQAEPPHTQIEEQSEPDEEQTHGCKGIGKCFSYHIRRYH